MFDDAIRPKMETEGKPPSVAPERSRLVVAARPVRCELPDSIEVLPGEVELIQHLLGELIPTLFE